MTSFEAAFKALEAGDVAALEAMLAGRPELVRLADKNGNTLLNLAVSLKSKAGAETLLRAGADVNGGNVHGWTPLHQAGYSNQSDVAALLLERGADVEAEARGDGGTALIAALFWGHREVAELLAKRSTAPGNLRVAAGLGDLELMEKCFRGETELAEAAFAGRGFYRPHSGFPEWTPSADRQEVLDEALVWAAKAGRTVVMPRLVRAGARVDADPYRGTALIWAASCNRLEAAEWLLDNGATVNLKATFGGLTHGKGYTALHAAAQYGWLAMVKLLVSRGADARIREDLYGADALGVAGFW